MKKNKAVWWGVGILAALIVFGGKMVMKYFQYSEFDSPDVPGSGKKMQNSTLALLDRARTIAGIPFFIVSGYRTASHNEEVGGVQNSAHTRGYGVDIRTGPETQKIIIKALIQAGFKRIGIGSNFVHADNDPAKPSPTAWGYPVGSPAPFNPFTLA